MVDMFVISSNTLVLVIWENATFTDMAITITNLIPIPGINEWYRWYSFTKQVLVRCHIFFFCSELSESWLKSERIGKPDLTVNVQIFFITKGEHHSRFDELGSRNNQIHENLKNYLLLIERKN